MNLNLPKWEVASVKESANDYRVEATYSEAPAHCPRCRHLPPKIYRHGTRAQLLTDLPADGKRVGIHLTRYRYRCQDCGKTFLQPLPDVDERSQMTRRLAAAVRKAAAAGHPFALIARAVGVSERTVRNLHYGGPGRKKRGRGVGPKKGDVVALLEFFSRSTDLEKSRSRE